MQATAAKLYLLNINSDSCGMKRKLEMNEIRLIIIVKKNKNRQKIVKIQEFGGLYSKK